MSPPSDVRGIHGWPLHSAGEQKQKLTDFVRSELLDVRHPQ
ncbi:hypothetical protein ACIBCB_09895 [Streptomyces uncialis]